jgi:hypothetical protein
MNQTKLQSRIQDIPVRFSLGKVTILLYDTKHTNTLTRNTLRLRYKVQPVNAI